MLGLNIKKALLVWVLSLPTPVLRLLSGGTAVYQGGRTLDPRLQFLAAMARRGPQRSLESTDTARQAIRQGVQNLKPRSEPGVTAEPYSIAGPAGEIPCRLYRPGRQDPAAPVMVYAHFGWGVVGDLESCDSFCQILARVSRGPVLSVDYRLAPEHKYPAGRDDVFAAFLHARDHAEDFGAPKGKAAIGGDSIGGAFAAALCQHLRDTGEPQPELQLLIYPVTDMASETASMTTYAGAYPIDEGSIPWFAGHYLGADDNPTDPGASPLRAKSFNGLAPAIVATAGFDPLVDQGQAYARALREAGVRTTYRCYDSLAHAFVAYTGVSPAADAACREIAGLARSAYEGPADG